jgi:hypothetical protein
MSDAKDDPIVGHKTFAVDGGGYRHEPLRKSEAEAFIASADAAKEKRRVDMPTEQDAVRALWSAYQRLKELGWRETCYAPTDVRLRVIEPSSSGIHIGSRHHPWPEKTWWLESHDDLWPSTPCLYNGLLAEEQKRATAQAGEESGNE